VTKPFSYEEAAAPQTESFSYEDASGEKPKPASALRKLGDLGLSVAKGVIAVPEAAVGLADLATGGRAGKLAESAGVRFKDAKDVLSGFQSDDLKGKQQQFQQADGILDKTGVAVTNPSLIANAVAESVPSMGAGGVGARALMAAAPKLGAVGAGALGEGLVGAGSAAEQIRQQTEDGLLTGKQAALAGASGAATAAFGAAGGKVASKLGIGDVDTMIANGTTGVAQSAAQANKGMLRRGAEGFLSEGVLEELPQSLSEQILQNEALGKDWREGLDEAAVMAVLSGGAMGAGAGVLTGTQARDTSKPAEVPPVAPPEPAGQLGYSPDPLISFPDGTVGRQAEVDAFVAKLPEREQMSARARLMGLAPQPATPAAEVAPEVAPVVPPSVQMGINPAAGVISAVAAQAVDSGQTQEIQLSQAAEQDQAIYEQAMAEQEQQAAEQDTADKPITSGSIADAQLSEEDRRAILFSNEAVADGGRQYDGTINGDILNGMGQPFATRYGAARRANLEGKDWTIAPVFDGWVARRKDAINGATDGVSGAATGSGEQGSDQPAPSVGLGAADGNAVGADAPGRADDAVGEPRQSAGGADDAAVVSELNEALAPMESAQAATETIANVQNTAPAANDPQAEAAPVEAGTPVAGNAAPAADVPGAGSAPVESAGVEQPKKPGVGPASLGSAKADMDHLFGVDQKRAKAIERVNAGKAWFGNAPKAGEFINKNGLKDTHEWVKTGASRFEVREKATTQEALQVPSERETRIASALANGGHVVGADLRDRTGMRLMGLTPEELKTIPADKVRAKPSAEAARTDSTTTKGNEDGTQTDQTVETTSKQPQERTPGQPVAADPERFERSMRASATIEQTNADDVQTTGLRYVPFEVALKIVREAVADGVPQNWVQLHSRLDLTADSAQRLLQAVGKPKQEASTTIEYVAPMPAPKAADDKPNLKKTQAKRKAAIEAVEAEEAKTQEAARADYFTPGNIVKSYGGQDEVLSYTPGENGGFSVKVHAVRKVDGEWIREGKPQNARTHSTMPDARELAQGPIERLGYQPANDVKYSQPRADGTPLPNAVDRGAKPAGEVLSSDQYQMRHNGARAHASGRRRVPPSYFAASSQKEWLAGWDAANAAAPVAEAKQGAPVAPKPEIVVDKAEKRPYRKPDGSVGYEAVPIAEDKPAEPAKPYRPSKEASQAWNAALERYALANYRESGPEQRVAFGEGYMRAFDGVASDPNAKHIAAHIDGVLFFERTANDKPIDSGKPTPAPESKPNSTGTSADTAPAAIETVAKPDAKAALSEREKAAKAKMFNALGKLATLAGKNTRMNWTQEEEQQLLPIVIELFDGAMELGAVSFQQAVAYVRDFISTNLDSETADAIPFDTLQGAYISVAGRHKDKAVTSKKEVVSFESLAEIGTPEPARAEQQGRDTLTAALSAEILSGKMPKDNPALKKLVEAFDGQPADQSRMKEAQEALEAAIVSASRDVVAKNEGPRSTFDALLRLYESQPNLSIRTSTSIANQAYSTPAPLAFLGSELAGVSKATTVYEPTAGNGMLTIGAKPSNVTVNELEAGRIESLKAQGFKEVLEGDALEAKVAPKSQDRVMTNPPFGSVKDSKGVATKVLVDGFKIGQIDHLIAARALETMKDDGKATLIIGANKVAGGLNTDDRIFFNWLYGNYNVTSHFEVEGDLYQRQGAGWPVRVITIGGRVKSGRASPVAGTIQRAQNWEQVYEHFAANLDANRAKSEPGAVSRPGGEGAGQAGLQPVRQPAGKSNATGSDQGQAGSAVGAGNVAGTRAGNVADSAQQPNQQLGGADSEQRLNAESVESDRLDPAGDSVVTTPAKSAGSAGATALSTAENQFQVTYEPRSSRKDGGVLIPVNMKDPTQDALSRLEDAVGNIDDYAVKQLGYKSAEELHGALMGLQVDSVASAIYQIEQGKGVIIADQTGIGKGRQAAAVIRWAERSGHIPVFVSVTPSLFTDIYGDLHDIGSDNINPFILNKEASIKGPGDTKLFANKAIGHKQTMERVRDSGQLPAGSNAIFMTYSQVNTDNVQRQMLTAIADRAVFILDESHNAGGQSNTGEFITSLLEGAKGVTYLSATYAKRPDNMPLYFKTDIGQAAADNEGLMQAMANGGLPLQTVVSNNLVKAGQMFRRERSYDGVSIETIVDTKHRADHEALSDETTKALRAIVDADAMFHEVFVKQMNDELQQSGGAVIDNAGNQAQAGVDHTQFSSVVHNFVKQMLLGLKAQRAADDAIAALKRDEKPIIAVENTMGSFLEAYAKDNMVTQGGDLGSFDYRTVLSRALARTRVLNEVLPNGDKAKRVISLSQLDEMTRSAYEAAQAVIDGLDLSIPVSPIDWIRNEVRKAGFTIAEITGRKLAVDYSVNGKATLGSIDALEQTDKVRTTQLFNSGRLDALILNVAGSTGISLHASEKFQDQRQRHMIIAQAAGDINIFMQMLGRVHRTGQVKLPKYSILSVDLPTEKRPTAVLSGKMKSLNANTSSNTDSATSIKTVDMFNKYGDKVVSDYLRDNYELARALDVEDLIGGDDAAEDLARKATGRLALQPIEVQHAFYEEIEAQYSAMMEYLNKTNQNDLEPRTFDYDAQETRQDVLFEGANKDSPFGEDAIYGEYSIKAQGKAMTPAEIREAMAENLSGQRPDAHVESLISGLLEQWAKKFNEDRAKHGLAPGAFNADKYRTFVTGIYGKDSAEAFVQSALAKIAKGEEIENITPARLSNTADAMKGITFMRNHAVGNTFRVDINGDMFNAVVTNIRSTHKVNGNPFSLSKIQVTLALNGALRSITVPATQFQRIEVSAIGRGYTVEQLFKEQPANQRETAKVVTGNLLAAYGELTGVRGTIIAFTKQDGTTEQGILLPKTFDFKSNTRGDYRLPTAQAAFTFLQKSENKDIGRFGIQSRDGVVRVLPAGNGVSVLVPKSKLKGGKYFLDKGLIEALGDFVTSGSAMKATTYVRDKAVQALDLLMKKNALYAIPSMAEEAKDLTEDDAPVFSRSAGPITRVRSAADYYGTYGAQGVSKGIKQGKDSAIKTAAAEMARLIPPNATLVPIPSSGGKATHTLKLAQEIAKLTGSKVADVLQGEARQSLYELKKAGGDPGGVNFGYRLNGAEPTNPVLIDGVFDTGTTMRAALQVLPNAEMAVYAQAQGVDEQSTVLKQDGSFDKWPMFNQWTRAEYNDVISLLPAEYRADPHRREPLPAPTRKLRAAAFDADAAGKGYSYVIDALGNVIVNGADANTLAGIAVLTDRHGLGLFATNVRIASMPALRAIGFVPEMGAGTVLQRAAGSKETPAPKNKGDSAYRTAPGTMMSLEPRGFPAPMFSLNRLSRTRATFSRGAQVQANESVETVAMAIASKWENTPEIVVAFDMNDPIIPEAVRKEDQRQRSGGATGTPEGFYYKGRVYLMSSKLGTANDIARVLFHETLGHYGLRSHFGKEMGTILRDVATLRRAEVDAKIKQYGLKGINLSDRLVAAEEVLAELAQTRPEIGFVKRAIAAVRTWLRQNVPGFASLRLSDAELIRNYILPARQFVESGGRPKGVVRVEPTFSRGKNDDMTNSDVVGNTQGGRSADDSTPGDLLRKIEGTQVVDSNGAPLLVYHGSKSQIDRFDASKTIDGGLHFGSKSQASMRSSKILHPAYLYAENIRRSKDTGSDWKAKIASAKAAGYDGIVYLNRYEGVSKETVFRLHSQGLSEKLDRMSDAEFRRAVPEAEDSYIVFDAKQVIQPNESTASDSGGAMFSRTLGETVATAANNIHDVSLPAGYVVGDFFKSAPGKLSWWHKTVGTMYDLAQRSPQFKRVFDGVQNFINDVSYYATEAADLAPNILPKLESWKDITKSPLSPEDTKAISAPIFEGTLTWARDESGKPIEVATLEAQAKSLTPEQKAQRLLRNDKVDANVLKMWQGLPIEQFEAIIEGKYEREMLKAGIVWTPAELRQKFKLTGGLQADGRYDGQIGLYQEFRKATDKSLTNLAISDMLRFGGKDTAPIRERVLSAANVVQAGDMLRDYLMDLSDTDPDRKDVLLDTANKMVEKSEKAKDLIERGYAPLSRYGQYTLDVVSQDGERVYFGMFESKMDAARMARRLEQEYPGATMTRGTVSEEEYKLFAGVSPETLELFGDMLGLEAQGDGAAAKAFQTYLKLAKSNRSSMKRMIQRKGIAGFSEDSGRVLAGFVYSNARQTASNLHMGEMTEAANEVSKKDGELKDQAVRLVDYVKNPREEAQAFRGLLFAQYIGGSIASAMVNMTQPLTMTFPWLSQYGTVSDAAKQMTAAMRDASKSQTGDARLDAALKRAEEDGTVSPQEVHQLMQQSQGRGALQSGDGTRAGNALAAGNNFLSRVSLGWGKLFGLAEQFNRRATFIAAYRMAVANGMKDPDAFARKAIAETQGVYNKGNKPAWARGAVGSTLFTFKQYSIAYMEMLHRMYKSGPEGKKAALLALAVLFLMSGAGGLPGSDDLDDLISGLLQRMGYNFDTKAKRKEFFASLVGEGGAQFLETGISGLPGMPLDVSGRLGMGNLIPGTGVFQKKADYTRDVLEIAGPGGDFVKRGFDAAGKVIEGDVLGLNGAVRTIAPKAVQNLYQSYDMASMGMYRDAKGMKVLDTDGYDAALKAIGFQPNDVKKVQDASFEAQRMIGLNRLRESEIANRWALGIFEKDSDKVRAAREELREWNETNPASPIRINFKQILQRVQKMNQTKAERIAATAPKEIRNDVRNSLATE
jgi:predicted RNA methylase